jgi:hypothetical protein
MEKKSQEKPGVSAPKAPRTMELGLKYRKVPSARHLSRGKWFEGRPVKKAETNTVDTQITFDLSGAAVGAGVSSHADLIYKFRNAVFKLYQEKEPEYARLQTADFVPGYIDDHPEKRANTKGLDVYISYAAQNGALLALDQALREVSVYAGEAHKKGIPLETVYRQLLLEKDENLFAPGHHSNLKSAEEGKLIAVLHFYTPRGSHFGQLLDGLYKESMRGQISEGYAAGYTASLLSR